jgi:hypothetical protein
MTPFGDVTGRNATWTNARTVLGSGWFVEAHLGVRMSPLWSIYAFGERGFLEGGYEGAPSGPRTWAVGLGFERTVPLDAHVAILFDMGMGIRHSYAQVPDDYLTWRNSNPQSVMPLRAGFGFSYQPLKQLRFDAMATVNFAHFAYGGDCPDGCVDGYGFAGLALGARWLP